MSLEERVTVLEEKIVELTTPKRICIFCHDGYDGQKTSSSYIAAYEFVRQAFIKDGLNPCDHDELGYESIWFADFIYGALLNEVISNHNLEQHNLSVNKQVLSNLEIMEKAINEYTIEKIKILEEWKQPEYSHAYFKLHAELLPKFNRIAKTLFDEDRKPINLVDKQTRELIAHSRFF